MSQLVWSYILVGIGAGIVTALALHWDKKDRRRNEAARKRRQPHGEVLPKTLERALRRSTLERPWDGGFK